MELDEHLDKVFVKIFLGFSEIIGATIAILFTAGTGAFFYFVRKHLYEWLKILGVTYFADRLKNIRDINSDLIWIQGAFKADVYGLFRTYNGKSYVEDSMEFSANVTDSKKLKQYEKIKVKKMNAKPEAFFPNYLDRDLYKFIIDQTVISDWKFFSYDSLKLNNPNSPILVFLESEGINNLLTYRIWDKNKKTYGIVLFTWGKDIDINIVFTKQISKKLDSIAIRFQTHIESSLIEKIGIRWNR